ncbi:DNA binding domain-containing protein, excisionase family [Pimelobacter simplex]|nr:DNA binding domain-containing protein, excisionase family [Pimelobacter simplex]
MQEAAAILEQSVLTVRRRIADGTLPAFRIKGSRALRVSEADVRAMLTPVPTVDRTEAS